MKTLSLVLARKIINILLITLLSNYCYAGEDRRWHEQGINLSEEIKQLLLNTGTCKSMDDCIRGKHLFFRSTSQGLEISLYNVQNQTTISLILAKLAASLAKEKMQSINLTIYERSKEVEMQHSGLFGEKSIMEFSIGGKYVGGNR